MIQETEWMRLRKIFLEFISQRYSKKHKHKLVKRFKA